MKVTAALKTQIDTKEGQTGHKEIQKKVKYMPGHKEEQNRSYKE